MNRRITFVAVMAWLAAAVYYFFQYALRSAPSVMIPQLADAFRYDAIYELLNATQGGTTKENYTYDPVGNRLSNVTTSGWSYTIGDITTDCQGLAYRIYLRSKLKDQLNCILNWSGHVSDAVTETGVQRGCYSLNTIGGPLTRFPLRSTVTSTRSAILMNGMPLFIPNSLRSNAIVPFIEPSPIPLPVMVKLNFSGLVTPRIDAPFGKGYTALICIFLGHDITGNKKGNPQRGKSSMAIRFCES